MINKTITMTTSRLALDTNVDTFHTAKNGLHDMPIKLLPAVPYVIADITQMEHYLPTE